MESGGEGGVLKIRHTTKPNICDENEGEEEIFSI